MCCVKPRPGGQGITSFPVFFRKKAEKEIKKAKILIQTIQGLMHIRKPEAHLTIC
jgi:hypothetical protein